MTDLVKSHYTIRAIVKSMHPALGEVERIRTLGVGVYKRGLSETMHIIAECIELEWPDAETIEVLSITKTTEITDPREGRRRTGSLG